MRFTTLGKHLLTFDKVNTFEPFNSEELMISFPLQLPHISFPISYENLVLDQHNFYLSLSILITCLLNNVWIVWGKAMC